MFHCRRDPSLGVGNGAFCLALALRIEGKGLASGEEFRRHIAPLLRQAQEALGREGRSDGGR